MNIKQLGLHSRRNHQDATVRGYSSNYSNTDPKKIKSIQVISYNIQYGLNVKQAIQEFNTIQSLKNADIILFQEMDEKGTDTIAKTLRYNYVYYAAGKSIHNKNFGNAVLSKYPIINQHRIPLENIHPITGEKRIATNATIQMGTQRVSVYSVHTEVYSTLPSFRRSQIQSLIDAFDRTCSYGIVGGDFNTVSKRSIRRLDEQFRSAQFNRVSADNRKTIRLQLFKPVLDHIYTKGFICTKAGIEFLAQASDHLPIWTKLSF